MLLKKTLRLWESLEEVKREWAYFEDLGWRDPEDFHEHLHLLLLVLAGEDGEADEELGDDAPEAPHVDGHGVRQAQDHFRRAVEPALDVRVDLLVLEAARPEVHDLDPRLVRLLQQDVLRLQVAVHDFRLAYSTTPPTFYRNSRLCSI